MSSGAVTDRPVSSKELFFSALERDLPYTPEKLLKYAKEAGITKNRAYYLMDSARGRKIRYNWSDNPCKHLDNPDIPLDEPVKNGIVQAVASGVNKPRVAVMFGTNLRTVFLACYGEEYFRRIAPQPSH